MWQCPLACISDCNLLAPGILLSSPLQLPSQTPAAFLALSASPCQNSWESSLVMADKHDGSVTQAGLTAALQGGTESSGIAALQHALKRPTPPRVASLPSTDHLN